MTPVQRTRGRHEFGAIEPDPRVADIFSISEQTFEDRAARTSSPERWVNVHPLGFRGVAPDPTQASHAARLFVAEREHQPMLGGWHLAISMRPIPQPLGVNADGLRDAPAPHACPE